MRIRTVMVLTALALAGCRSAPAAGLQVGDEAPGFSLPAVGGAQVALSDYTGVSPVLLFFHMAVG
jgi:hypothetical protein